VKRADKESALTGASFFGDILSLVGSISTNLKSTRKF